MLITDALAQSGAGGQEPGILASLAPFLLIILVMYFLLFRPQQQRVKKHKEMIAAVKVGDVITTGGGLVAKISKIVDERFVAGHVSDGVEVYISRNMIADVMGEDAPPFAKFRSDSAVVARPRSRAKPKSAKKVSESKPESDLESEDGSDT